MPYEPPQNILSRHILDLDPQAEDFALRLEALKEMARKHLDLGGVGRGGGAGGRLRRELGHKASLEKAITLHRQVRPIIDRLMKENPGITWMRLARELDRLNVKPPRSDKWAHTTVQMIAGRPKDWSGEKLSEAG